MSNFLSNYRRNSIASMSAYQAQHKDRVEHFQKASKEAEQLLKVYGDVLPAGSIAPVGFSSTEEVESRIKTVIMNAYRVFDETHKRYKEILRLVRLNHPAWVSSIEADHERKLSLCKGKIFPID